ncbi:protease [Seminavis robusta]|uniref:Protease n=1 Tax=Seminavis robusta TaxID=568900 RepID=A0A9N8EUX6_9STRA|nr:protease [Seminavis robusta]|eukprot:Sro1897_g304080.1 protease (188) ;mRNA; f:5574-6279
MDGTIITVDASNSKIHPDWCPGVANPTPTNCQGRFGIDVDLAVLKLDTFSSNDVVCLNEDNSIPILGGTAEAMGFGLTESGDPTTFQGATLPVSGCRPGDSSWYFCTDATPAATSPNTCPGDSGGPTNVPNCNTQLGVVSFGIGPNGTPQQVCLSSTLSGYQRVDTHIAWIEAQICALSASPPAGCP